MAGKKGYSASDAAKGAVALAKAAGKVAAGNYVGAAKDAIKNADKILPIIIAVTFIWLILIIAVVMGIYSLFFSWFSGPKMTQAEQTAAEKAIVISQYQALEKSFFEKDGIFTKNEDTIAQKIIDKLEEDIPDIETYIKSGYKQMVSKTEDSEYVYPSIEEDKPLCVLVNNLNNPQIKYESTQYGQIYQNSLYVLNKTGKSYLIHFDCEQYIKSGYGPMFFSQLYQLKLDKEGLQIKREAEQALSNRKTEACTHEHKPCEKCDECLKLSEKLKWEKNKAAWCKNSEYSGVPCNDCTWCDKFDNLYNKLRNKCDNLTKYNTPCMKCDGCKDFLADNNNMNLSDENKEKKDKEVQTEKTNKFIKFMQDNCNEILTFGITFPYIENKNFKVDPGLGFGDNLVYDINILTIDVRVVDKEILAEIFGIAEKKEDHNNDAEAARLETRKVIDSGFEMQTAALEYLQTAGYEKSNIFWQFSHKVYKKIFEKDADFSSNTMPITDGEIIYQDDNIWSPLYNSVHISGMQGDEVKLFADSSIYRIGTTLDNITFRDAHTNFLYYYGHINIPQEFIDQYNAQKKGGEKIVYKANTVIGYVPQKTEEEIAEDEETEVESPHYIVFGILVLNKGVEASVNPLDYIKQPINITLCSSGYCWPAPDNLLVTQNVDFKAKIPITGIKITNKTDALTDGKPVVAASSGIVKSVTANSVLIQHDNTSTFYDNLTDIKVKQNQPVNLGTKIGEIASSDGLYFELRNNNTDENKDIIAKENGVVSYIENKVFKDITTGVTYNQKTIFVTSNGLRINYHNCKTVNVKVKDSIKKGQVIGKYGKTKFLYDYPLTLFPQDEVEWIKKES